MYKDPWNLSDATINNWAYWLFEENIKLINSVTSKKGKGIDLADPNLTGPLQ